MITCGGCTAIYPDELETCPHCGAQTPRDTGTEPSTESPETPVTEDGAELRHGDLDAHVDEPETKLAATPGMGVTAP